VPFARGARRLNPGTVRLRVAELALQHDITNQFGTPNIQQIHHGTELSAAVVRRFLHAQDDSAISLDQLARICHYFDCEPGDVLTYDPPEVEPLRA
jgi:DNA-binding Xre family transcriptional regulator